jgi:hypothetical protein
LGEGRKIFILLKLSISIKEEKKEEFPLGVKIIGVAIRIGAVVLLATYDRLLKMLRLKKSKTK